MPADKAAIGARLREAREAPPRWSREQMARRLRDAADRPARRTLPAIPSLTHMIKEWETGKHLLSPRYRTLYARALGVTEEALFGRAGTGPAEVDDDATELVELARRAETSDLGVSTLRDIGVMTDQLRREYPAATGYPLRARLEKGLRYVLGLVDGRTTLHQHRQLLVQAGWLAALLGCVDHDLGRCTEAELARRLAFRLGEQAGDREIVAWAWDMATWFAPMGGRTGDTAAPPAGTDYAQIDRSSVR
jgi:transcriptional regulator with XRE-family HTH domain